MMTTRDPLRRIHLSLPESLIIRVDKAFADAAARDHDLDRTEFIRRAIVFYLENNDEILGSRAALAYKVGDRLTDKLEVLSLLLLVILRVIVIRFEISNEIVQVAFDWAGKSRSGFEQHAAKVRNANRLPKGEGNQATNKLNIMK